MAAIPARVTSSDRLSAIPQRQLIGVEKQLASHGLGEVAVGLLDQQTVGELTLGTQHRKVVLRPPRTLSTGGIGVDGSCLAEEVDPDVGQRDVLLEFGPVRDPLPQALGQNEVVVGVAQQIREQRRLDLTGRALRLTGNNRLGPSHIFPTSSGIS